MQAGPSQFGAKAGHTGSQGQDSIQLSDDTESDQPVSHRQCKKRKRTKPAQGGDDSDRDSEILGDEATGAHLAQEAFKPRPLQRGTAVRVPAMIYPRSSYLEHERTLQVSSERDVLRKALAYHETSGGTLISHDEKDFIAFNVDDFSIFRPPKTRPTNKSNVLEELPGSNELLSLHDAEGRGIKYWFLDGWITYGAQKEYLHHVPCEILSIGGYEDTDLHTVGREIWVQSRIGQRSGVWYCLGQPASEYRLHHKSFLWIADLGKHLIDYLDHHENRKLLHFRDDFHSWIQATHGADPTFQNWLQEYSDTDFRRVLTTHACFLYNQAIQLDKDYVGHALWSEIDPTMMDAVPRQTEQVQHDRAVSGDTQPAVKASTVVTPYVYECFKHLPWAKFLYVQKPAPSTFSRKQTMHIPSVDFHPLPHDQGPLQAQVGGSSKDSSQHREVVSMGDVVAVPSDYHTDWKSNDSSWYGYVQGVSEDDEGTRLSLLWLYRPSDTPCLNMIYPFSNELFLSEHCNCDDTAIYAHEVTSKLNVAFYGDSKTPNADYFVRQKYMERDGVWITLNQADFRCDCKEVQKSIQLKSGDTWLVRNMVGKEKALEPVVILQSDDTMVTIRRLRRLDRDYQVEDADLNELVYSSEIDEISRDDLCRRCHVRFYTPAEKTQKQIPAPYNRGGAADYFYISHCDHDNLKALQKPYPPLNQGFDPSVSSCHTLSCPTMRGLDIFCGGGSFGRGLEEGGAVHMEWAIDYFREAIHTYRANVKDPEKVNLFYGSVNDYLSQAMKGKCGNTNLIARRGEVELIAAGSPCQGFSMINNHRSKDSSLINISMIASVISFIDFYRPKYALLENVLGMTRCGVENKKQNVFAQVICALVGMGYQVRPFLLDAWNFGAPQSRTRLFISIAAAGLSPLLEPTQSHSHPIAVNDRALGKMANGLSLGKRHSDETAFQYVSIEEATRDLPLNQHGKLTSIRFPDHRLSRSMRALDQGRIECIPKYPNGMNFVKAVQRGVMPEPQIGSHIWTNSIRSGEKSKCWQRVVPNGLVATVTTSVTPEDGIAGHWIHWEADRPMTILEVRRAQGFPDREVIVGSPTVQWKIVGNSVARQVALALGLSLREAWLANAASTDIAMAAHDPVIIDEMNDAAIVGTSRRDSDSNIEDTPLASDIAEQTPRKRLARGEMSRERPGSESTISSNLTHRPKSRASQLVKPPATTLTKRLRSSLMSEEFFMLPKKRRGMQQSPVVQHNSIDSAIEISSDEEPSNENASQSTAHTDQAIIEDMRMSDSGDDVAFIGKEKKRTRKSGRLENILKIGESIARISK